MKPLGGKARSRVPRSFSDSNIKQPSLRALAKQSIQQHKERMDCFVAFAPRNDFRYASALPRRKTPELINETPALCSEGAGNAGRSMRPQPCVQSKKHTSVVTTVTPETS